MAAEIKTKKQIWKRWWFWALIVAVLIGGVIEFTEPATEEPATTIVEPTTEPTATKEPETEKTEQTEEPKDQTHIYDNAIVKDVMNGFRTEKIGEYSVIEIASDQITEDSLADWYFNYVSKNDFNWCMILYTDKNNNEGIYANSGYVSKDVMFEVNEYGDYALGDSSNCTMYYSTDDGNLIEKTEPETEKNDTEEIKDISAYELLTMEGHPVLYDYLSSAHAFWDNYAEERIDFPDDYFDDFQSGKTALVIDAWLSLERDVDEHMIRDFEIYPNKEISLDEGLDLAKSYLPLEIMKKWYYLSNSECYYSQEDNRHYYYLLYVPTESGKEEIEKLENKYSYNYVMLLLYVKNGNVDVICIRSTNTVPREIYNYEAQEWTYDFLINDN